MRLNFVGLLENTKSKFLMLQGLELQESLKLARLFTPFSTNYLKIGNNPTGCDST